MTIRALLVVSVLFLLAGCAAPAVRESAIGSIAGDPRRQILITLHNIPSALRGAGSTRRGVEWQGVGYSVSPQAAADAQQLARDYGLRALDAWPIRMLGVHCVVFDMVGRDADREDLLARLRADRRVESAQPMGSFETAAVGSGAGLYSDLQHGFSTLQVEQAHRWARGRGVRVAVIDTGADRQHPELAGRVAGHADLVDASGDASEAGFDSDRHGTAIAGVIAARADNFEGIVGVAPEASLVLLKACWPLAPDVRKARCNSFTLALALAAAQDHDADIINLSLAGPRDALLERMLAQLLDDSRVVVGVAADADETATALFPAAVPGVIAVSDRGSSTPVGAVLIAPGEDILTLAPQGRYEFQSGSSLAAAHVSGIVALLREREPQLDANRAYALLRKDAMGKVNACAALSALLAEVRCAPVVAAEVKP